MNKFKKVLSAVLVFTTVLWSVGLSLLPLSASAATLTPGMLIKGKSLSTVYYYAADGKRYVFPNEDTYFSWYEDFSDVVEITDQELAAVPIGGNIVMRAGTWLVKIQSDPKVYAVGEEGTLHWVPDESTAEFLFGSMWSDHVRDVPDAFFTNYNIGDPISATNPMYPLGTVITDGTNYYVIGNPSKHLLEPGNFDDFHFQDTFAYPAPESVLNALPEGDAWSGDIDPAQLNGYTPPATGKVGVTHLTDKYVTNVPGGEAIIPSVWMRFENPYDHEIWFVGGDVMRAPGSLITDNSFDEVFFVDENGVFYGSGSLVDNESSIRFYSEPLKLGPGQSLDVALAHTFVPNVQAGTTQFKVKDLEFSTEDGQLLNVTPGVLPITGPVQQIFPGQPGPQVDLASNVINGGTLAAPVDVEPKDGEVRMLSLKLQEQLNQNDWLITGLKISNRGTIDDDQVEKIEVRDASTNEVLGHGYMDDNEIIVIFDEPEVVEKGKSITLDVYVYLVGGVNSIDRTIDLAITEARDIYIFDNVTGFQFLATSGTPFPVDYDENVFAVAQETPAFRRASDSPSGTVAQGSEDEVLAIYEVDGDGSYEYRRTQLLITKNGGPFQAGDRVPLKGNVRFFTAASDQVVIGSVDARDSRIYGGGCTIDPTTETFQTNCGATPYEVRFSRYMPAEDDRQVIIKGDLNNPPDGTTFKLSVQNHTTKNLLQNTIEVFPGIVDFHKLTVRGLSFSVTQSGSYNPLTMVAGGDEMKLAEWNSTCTGGDVLVSGANVGIDLIDGPGAFTGANSNDIANDIDNVYLEIYQPGSLVLVDRIGPKSFAGAGGTTFSFSQEFMKDDQNKFVVTAVVNSSINTTAANLGITDPRLITQITFNSVTGMNTNDPVPGLPVVVDGQDIQLVANGTLEFKSIADPSINSPEIKHAGQQAQNMYKFQIKEPTNAEEINLTEMHFVVVNADANADDFELYSATGEKYDGPVSPNNGVLKFTGMNLDIPKGGASTMIQKASINNPPLNIGTPFNRTLTNDIRMTPSYYAFTGSDSGRTVEVSGGVMQDYLLGGAATDEIRITDPTFFFVNNPPENVGLVYVDFNNDGDFEDAVAGAAYAPENVLWEITAINGNFLTLRNANTLAALDLTGATIPAADIMGAVVPFKLYSDKKYVHETELTLAHHATYKDPTQGPETQLMSLIAAANGPRTITLDSIKVQFTGSYPAGYGPKNPLLWPADESSGKKSSTPLTNTSNPALLAYLPGMTYNHDGAGNPVPGTGVAAQTYTNMDVTQVQYAITGPAANDDNVNFEAGNRVIIVDCDNTEGTLAQPKFTNGGLGYRVTAVSAGMLSFAPTLSAGTNASPDANIDAGDCIVPIVAGSNTLNDGNTWTAGDDVLEVDGAGVLPPVDSLVVFHQRNTANDTDYILSNNGVGYRIMEVDTATREILIQPALEAPLDANLGTNNTKVVLQWDGTGILGALAAAPLESGAEVRFPLPTNYDVEPNGTTGLGITADVTYMKPANSSATSSLSVAVPGVKSIAHPSNGAGYTYEATNGDVWHINECDSYKVNGFMHYY